MTTALLPSEIILPARHPGQRAVASHPARFKILSCGRRWGKSMLGSALCLEVALKGGRAWWVAPDYPRASVGWTEIRKQAIQIPGAVVREVERKVELPTGGWVQAKSADNPDSLRGQGLDFIVFDEAAFADERAWTEALRPALSDRKGRALIISTPRGRNWFWRVFTKASTDGGEWAAFQFPSSSNPFLDSAEIEAARQDMTERTFAQEYLAEFLEDGGGVFRNVEALATVEDVVPTAERTYVLGVDLARRQDWTAVAVLDVSEPTYQAVSVERWNGVDWPLQVARIRAVAERYRAALVVVDQTGVGDPVTQQLQRDLAMPVQGVVLSAPVKSAVVESLALGFERSEIRIVPDPVLVSELQAYESQRLPGGGTRYSAPDGLHDDTVMALALAWWGAKPLASRIAPIKPKGLPSFQRGGRFR